MLPSISFTSRQKVFKAVADGGSGRNPSSTAQFHFCQKTDRSRADEQRPITAFSVWTVGYDKAQYKAAAEWLEKLMPWQMRGARPGGMTLDVAWIVELTLEHHRLKGTPAFGYFMDREKCFDRLPWEVMYELEMSAGYKKNDLMQTEGTTKI